MSYTVTLENLEQRYAELSPLFEQHYAEMCERLSAQGVRVSPYAPRTKAYFDYNNSGWLLCFVLRFEGLAVGYSNVYVTQDMHNGDIIAQEDTVFVTRNHRNGAGKMLVKCVLDELRRRDVRRLSVAALTDLRVAKLWRRMGFKDVATQMVYEF